MEWILAAIVLVFMLLDERYIGVFARKPKQKGKMTLADHKRVRKELEAYGKKMGYFLVLLSIWTYGNEANDMILARGEWDTFSRQLQCEVRQDNVWCKVDGVWHEGENKVISTPWGLE